MVGESLEQLAKELEEMIESEKKEKPKLKLSAKDLRILVETIKLSEEIKPSQHAKRVVFAKHRIIGTERDRLLTALFYEIMKKQGLLDKMAQEALNLPSLLILDPWLRAALRAAVNLLVYHRLASSTKRWLRYGVADYISAQTHPYVGMYYWQAYEILSTYKPRPKSVEEYLEYKYLLPAWFIKRMRELLGPQESEELFKALNAKPLISIRVNTLKASVDEVVEELKREGKNPKVSPRVPVVVKFKGPYDFDHSKLYLEGKIFPQEEAAAAASIILDPKPGMVVVDLCAAPGGKTIHMAELMKNKGVIHAIDIDEPRIKRMRILIRRAGVTIVRVHKMDARNAAKKLGEEIADRVLVDAPCTSTGTINKNPELRWRIHEEGIDEITSLQRELLEVGVKLLKPGGKLLYTTCSLLPEEGEHIVQWILKKYEGRLKLVPLKGPYDPSPLLPETMRAWPHRHDTIGFFYALIEKVERR